MGDDFVIDNSVVMTWCMVKFVTYLCSATPNLSYLTILYIKNNGKN